MNRIQRIEHMEQILDEAVSVARALSDLLPRLEELSDYYQNGQWLKDYEADEAGLLPAGLKRGVLSQDAVYDLFSEYGRLFAQGEHILRSK